MDFSHSPKVVDLQKRVMAFVQENVIPGEKTFKDEMAAFRAAGNPWQHTQTMETLKEKAKAAGLWNMRPSLDERPPMDTLTPTRAAAPSLLEDCAVIELRDYTTHPGRRDELIALFEREFIETQETAGARVMAQFRDLDRPDHFVWLRGFADMASRREVR